MLADEDASGGSFFPFGDMVVYNTDVAAARLILT